MGVPEVADAGGGVYGAGVELTVIKTQKKLKTHHPLLNQWSPFNVRGNIGSHRINHFIIFLHGVRHTQVLGSRDWWARLRARCLAGLWAGGQARL
jgi:asparagine synthetase A